MEIKSETDAWSTELPDTYKAIHRALTVDYAGVLNEKSGLYLAVDHPVLGIHSEITKIGWPYIRKDQGRSTGGDMKIRYFSSIEDLLALHGGMYLPYDWSSEEGGLDLYFLVWDPVEKVFIDQRAELLARHTGFPRKDP